MVLDSSESTKAYVVRNQAGKYIRFSPTSFRMVQHARAGGTPEQLAQAMGVPPDEVRTAYTRLSEKLEATLGKEDRSRFGFFFTYDVLPSRWVIRLSRLFTWDFHRWSVVLLISLMVVAAAGWPFFRPAVRLSLDPTNTIYGYGLYFLSLLIHELGHSSGCLRFGAEPNAIGVGIYLAFPVMYSDVSAAWTLTRWQRAAVDMGGIYFQMAIGAVYLILFLLTGWGPWLLAIGGILGTVLFSLNPLFRFDGYWALSDALGVSNLSQQGRKVLGNAWERLRGRTPSTPLPWPGSVVTSLAVYGVLSFAAIAWLFVHMMSFMVARLIAYPGVVRDLIVRLLCAEQDVQLAHIWTFLTTTFGALLAGLHCRGRIACAQAFKVQLVQDHGIAVR